jgi:HD-like signal output (HDOD) protein
MKVLSRQERVADCVGDLTSRPGFPAFSKQIQRVLTAVDDFDISAYALTDLIIRDYSLTLRVLRAANSQNYSGRPILSITRAAIHLGTEAVRHIASSTLIFEQFHNKPAGVRELMMLSMLSANHVREIVRLVGGAGPEEAYLCGMARNLGEVLTAYYLPTQYARILALAEKQKQPLSVACLEVLQFSFEELASAIVRHWGMSETIAACQQPWAASRGSGGPQSDVLHAAVSLGHMLTTAVYRMRPEERSARIKLCLREHSAILPLVEKDVETILDLAICETKESFATMGHSISELRLRAQTRSALESLREFQSGEIADSAAETLEWLEPGAAKPEEDAGPARWPSEDTLERLTKDACAGLVSPSNFDLATFVLTVLEAIYRGIGFDRVLFGLANPDRTHIEGRLGLGDDIDALIKQFRFRISMSGGPVSVALLCKRTVVADAQEINGGDITRIFGCSYLVLYPILAAGEVVGCLYMESRKPRPSLTTRELSLLEQLREALATGIRRRS